MKPASVGAQYFTPFSTPPGITLDNSKPRRQERASRVNVMGTLFACNVCNGSGILLSCIDVLFILCMGANINWLY